MSLIDEFLLLLSPLAQLKSGGWRDLLVELGWAPDDIPGLPVDLLEERFAACQDAAVQFIQALGQSSSTPWTALSGAAEVFAAIDGLRDATGGAPNVPPELAALDEDVAAYLIDIYGDGAHPISYGAMRLLGLAHRSEDLQPAPPIVDPESGATLRSAYARPRVSFDSLTDIVQDPRQAIKILFGTEAAMGTQAGADALADVVMPKVAYLLQAFGANATYVADVRPVDQSLSPDQAELFRHVLLVTTVTDTDTGELEFSVGFVLLSHEQPQPGLLVDPSGFVDVDWATRSWSFSAAVGGVGEALIFGPSGVQLQNGSAPELDCQVTGAWASAGGPLVIGDRVGVHVELGSITVDAHASLASGKLVLAAGVTVSDGGLVVSASDGDGFLSSVLPAQPVRVPFAGDLEWSSDQGLRIKGTMPADSTLRLSAKTGIAFGPVALPQVTVILGADSSGPFAAATAEITAQLGPIAAAVDGFGLEIRAAAPGSGGNIGPLDVVLALRPPTSIALQVTSDVVTGGGFLSNDPGLGQYAGGVQLKFESLSLAAVGLLATKLPDGAHGYSLVVVVSVTFSPPIEVGFGFSIDGVGGLIGINRSFNNQALQDGLQKGSLDTVLFPPDVAKNPQKVISDLEQYFPAAPGEYVIGPMIQILWGEDGMFTASVGIIVEFPETTRATLLGRIQLMLPVPQAAVAKIEIDLEGTVDFAAKTVSFVAFLRNSRVAAFALTGGAALEASWGSQPAFLLSLGGWNPAFTPPSSFPSLPRLALALSNSTNPTVRFEAYLALTSNTLQFGAEVDLSASVDIPVLGTFAIAASVGFDALIQFVPFGFTVDIHASVALTWNKKPFLAVALELTLTGPQPLQAAGKASFSLLGSTHTLQFKHTFGAPLALPPPATINAAAELVTEFNKASSWTGVLPGPDSVVLTGAAGAPSSGLLLHPRGQLTVRQRLLPLDVQLTHLGQAQLAGGPATYSITDATLGSSSTMATVTDEFAMGQFIDLADDEKLSRPSFDLQPAGVTIGGGATTIPTASGPIDQDIEQHILTRDPVTGELAPTASVPSVRQVTGDEAALHRIRSAALRAVAMPGLGSDPAPAGPVSLVARTYAVADRDSLIAMGSVTAPLADIPAYTTADQARVSLTTSVPANAQVVPTLDSDATPVTAVTGLDADAWYFIVACHSGMCLAVAGEGEDDGDGVIQTPRTDAGNLYWQLKPASPGTFTIVAEHSGKALAELFGGAGGQNGTPIVQWDVTGGFAQEWRLVRVAAGRYRIELMSAGRCLDVVGAGTTEHTPVQLWDWWGGLNQQWRLERVSNGMLWHQRIAERAYTIWQQEGWPLWTSDLADWQRASSDVLTPIVAGEAEAAYERRGRGPGHDLDDWYGAVAEVVGQVAAAGQWPEEVHTAVVRSLGGQGVSG